MIPCIIFTIPIYMTIPSEIFGLPVRMCKMGASNNRKMHDVCTIDLRHIFQI